MVQDETVSRWKNQILDPNMLRALQDGSARFHIQLQLQVSAGEVHAWIRAMDFPGADLMYAKRKNPRGGKTRMEEVRVVVVLVSRSSSSLEARDDDHSAVL